MPSPLPPSFPLSLDTNTSFSTYTTGLQGTWADAGVLDKLRSTVIDGKDVTNNTTISKITGGPVFPIDSTLIAKTYQVESNLTKTLAFDAIPNPLNDYANYTYHIRFSMANEGTAYQQGITENSLNRMVIAESGKTVGFNISKFSMSQTVGPGFRHQNINATTWKMTITEPFGLTFSDQMQAAASRLEVRNHHRFPCFIEIWFDGYNEDGKIIPLKEKIYKIWRVMILECSLQTTEAGTVYELGGVTDNDIAATNEIAITQSLITLKEVQTLEQLITQLENNLNSDAKQAESQAKPVQYKFVLPEEMKNWSFLPATNDQNDNRQFDAKGGIITLNKGQDLGAFIINAIAKCEQAKDWLEGAPGSGGAVKASTVKQGLSRYIQVIPKIDINEYNPRLKDYVRQVTYYIHPFYTPRGASSVEEIEHLSQLEVQINKFNFWRDNNNLMLAKKYEYIYTGKNTEVIKFDISIENLWQIIVPTYNASSYHGNHTQGPKAAPNSQAMSANKGYAEYYQLGPEISARYAQLLDLVNNITGGSLSGASSALNNLNNSLTGLNSTINGIGGAINSVTSAAGSVTNAFGLSGISNNISNISGSINAMTSAVSSAFGGLGLFTSLPVTTFDYSYIDTKNKIANNIATNGTAAKPSTLPLTPLQQNLQNIFIESLPKVDLTSDVDPQPIVAYPANEPSSQQTINNGPTTKTDTTKSNTTPRNQAMFGKKIFNIYEKVYFLNITLEIRGDPWWLGMSNLEMNDYLLDLKNLSGANNYKESKKYANYLQGENVFLLTFKTGTDYDEETGLMKANSGSQYFNGLYSVMEVEHRFENGKFTQVLGAYKETFSQKIDKYLTPGVAQNVVSANNLSNVPGIIGGGNNPTATTPTGFPNNVVSDISNKFTQFGNMIA